MKRQLSIEVEKTISDQDLSAWYCCGLITIPEFIRLKAQRDMKDAQRVIDEYLSKPLKGKLNVKKGGQL